MKSRVALKWMLSISIIAAAVFLWFGPLANRDKLKAEEELEKIDEAIKNYVSSHDRLPDSLNALRRANFEDGDDIDLVESSFLSYSALEVEGDRRAGSAKWNLSYRSFWNDIDGSSNIAWGTSIH